jgi:tRNA pseudouridine-54 N-methylase
MEQILHPLCSDSCRSSMPGIEKLNYFLTNGWALISNQNPVYVLHESGIDNALLPP